MPRTLDDVSKETLGKNLKEARSRRGWTQVEAAKLAGVRRDRLVKWETGKETPGTEGLLLLAITYACPVDQLLSGVDEQYDEIIEARVPIDAQQHYAAKVDAVMATLADTLRQVRDAEAADQTRSATSVRTPTTGGKSATTRAHRKRGK